MDRRTFLQSGGIAAASVLVGAAPAPRRAGLGDALPLDQVLGGFTSLTRSGGLSVTNARSTGAFSALSLGLPGRSAGAWVRTRTAGAWTPWTHLPVAADHGPDGVDAAEHRVSELLWAAGSDGFQVALADDEDVSDLRAFVVDTAAEAVRAVVGPVRDIAREARGLLFGDDDADDEAGEAPGGRAPRPAVVSRASWGADESWRRGTPEYARPTRAVLHHTATGNDYGRDEVPAILRAIYHHHVRVRGWDDIGYNLLVDRFGRVFEGRAGGIDRGVIGAHASGHNSGSVGLAMIGNLEGPLPTPASVDAMAAVAAWKYRVHGIASDPDGRVTHGGRAYPTLCGHRDVGSTACPGGELYRRLPDLRREVHARS